MYYMVRKPKVRLKSTVKIRHWHKKEIEIYEENSFVEEQDGNGTVKYFIGSTYRTSITGEVPSVVEVSTTRGSRDFGRSVAGYD